MVVFAADHGLAARGVSAYPSDVTWQMVENFLAGGAAVSVLARQHGLALTVVDCGVRHDFAPRAGLRRPQDRATAPPMPRRAGDERRAVRAGDRQRPATWCARCRATCCCWARWASATRSAAPLLLARLAGLRHRSDCIGAGTGLDEAGVARKRAVLREVLRAARRARTSRWTRWPRSAASRSRRWSARCCRRRRERRVIVRRRLHRQRRGAGGRARWRRVAQRCVFAHRSAEPGHALLLQQLGAAAAADLDLRLGEGSGAALAWPLLESACRILREMASFESAGVSEAAEPTSRMMQAVLPTVPSLALQFFTRVPVTGRSRWVGFSPAMLRASAAPFPGASAGWSARSAALRVRWLRAACSVRRRAVAAVLSMVATVLADRRLPRGRPGRRLRWPGRRGDRERALEIMKDSRIGAFGAIALVLVLGLKAGCCWAALAAAGPGDRGRCAAG